MAILYTIGYEGLTLKELLEKLRSISVEVLVDVRENPFSKKPGFSKSDLASCLGQAAIGYRHFPNLGCSRESRHRYRTTRDSDSFYQEYEKHLATQSQALSKLLQQVLERVCCLMCLERNVEDCHRRILCDRLKELADTDLAIQHL